VHAAELGGEDRPRITAMTGQRPIGGILECDRVARIGAGDEAEAWMRDVVQAGP